MLDKDKLCGHLVSLLSSSELFQQERNSFISKLISTLEYSPMTYVKTCKSIKLALKFILECRDLLAFEVLPIDVQPFFTNDMNTVYANGNGDEIVSARLKDDFLNKVLHHFRNHDNYVKIVGGLSRLHSLANGRDPSQQERKLIRERIVSPSSFVKTDNVNSLLALIPDMVEKLLSFQREYKEDQYLPLAYHPASDKKSFAVDDYGKFTLAKRTELICFNTRTLMKYPSVYSLYKEYPNEFGAAAFVGAPLTDFKFDTEPSVLDCDGSIGKISCINEPGHKHRVVAIPHLLLGSLSYPLGIKLKKINSSWSIQGVDSHDKATLDLSSIVMQAEGKKTFYSFDCSDFTDRFPYKEFQRKVLVELLCSNYINEFDIAVQDLICYGKYEFLEGNERVHYTTGTPMGTYPSFPLCSLCNGLVALAGYLHHYGRRASYKDLPFKVIGDDIVIWDDLVADFYQSTLNDLGVVINQSKSVISTFMCEFCSKYISKGGVFQQKKIRDMNSVSAIVKNYDYYGENSFSLGFPELGDFIDRLATVPRPLGLAPAILPGNLFQINDLSRGSALLVLNHWIKEYSEQCGVSQEDFKLLTLRKSIQPSYSYCIDSSRVQQREINISPPWIRSIIDSLVKEVNDYNRLSDLDRMVRNLKFVMDLSPQPSKDGFTLIPSNKDSEDKLKQYVDPKWSPSTR